ncbi:MAG: tetratricopeptide repeat protein [Oscillospiraceae bacterium]|nr:tetratricopeptide repeat protein [Oscillospiraceae bacterium]
MDIKKSIDVRQFISQLDSCFNAGDSKAAKECISYWEKAARESGDNRGLLAVLNEAVGFYRRAKKKGKALAAMEESLLLVEKLELSNVLSGATIYINAATTLSFFGDAEGGLRLYDKAAVCYEEANKTNSYEYAALLNNRAGTLYSQKRFSEAEKDWLLAIDILKKLGGYDSDIAISFVMLAHLAFDTGDPDSLIETLLDCAWEYLNSNNQPKDGNYAYALRKCAPSFEFFQRPLEARALRDVAREIYDKGKNLS